MKLIAAGLRLGTSASSAKMPPSPLLSAFMMNVRYLTVTTIVSDQKISDRMPSRSASVGVPSRA